MNLFAYISSNKGISFRSIRTMPIGPTFSLNTTRSAPARMFHLDSLFQWYRLLLPRISLGKARLDAITPHYLEAGNELNCFKGGAFGLCSGFAFFARLFSKMPRWKVSKHVSCVEC